MPRYRIIVIIIVFCGVLYSQANSPNKLLNLRTDIQSILDDPNFSHAIWGVEIRSLKTGETLFKINSDKLFIPASNQKLFITSSALLLLGSQYKYHTNFYVNGQIVNGVLYGDLLIQGSGDPTVEIDEKSGKSVFKNWADSLKQKGIKKITGNLIGDDGAFEETTLGEGWQWDLNNYWFAAPFGALSFNQNSEKVILEYTVESLPVKLIYDATTSPNTFVNKVRSLPNLSRASIEYSKDPCSNIVTLFGGFPKKDSPFEVRIAIDNPTDYFLSNLKHYLKQNGIDISGDIVDASFQVTDTDYKEMKMLFIHKSPELKEIVTKINKLSNNFYAEQLFRTLGFEFYGFGSAENGVKAIKDLLKTMGINPENLSLVDGSGISRLNLVTPKQIVNLLSYMYVSGEFDSFFESLPIAGTDGTLSDRMRKTSAEGNVRGKTGFMENVMALSGYLKTAEGEPVAYSIMINNYRVPSSLAIYTQNLICQRITNFSRK